MRRPRVLPVALALIAISIAGWAAAPAQAADPGSTRLPCAEYDTSIGEYGAYVFRLRHKPSRCVEYKGNEPCHCTEAWLTGIVWHGWGSRRTTATATWRYCGMGSCYYRRARLVASQIRETCGLPVYTSLRMRLRGSRQHGEYLPPLRVHYRLPACSTVFSET
ncbi:MAG TPA: hypothetical protein VFS54_11245 [Solirubrobacterales bacterium]|nr:hypothetical protein [Solirubrobacterales bacterium]